MYCIVLQEWGRVVWPLAPRFSATAWRLVLTRRASTAAVELSEIRMGMSMACGARLRASASMCAAVGGMVRLLMS